MAIMGVRDVSAGALLVFFFNDTATTVIYTLSLHDALPISRGVHAAEQLAGTPGSVYNFRSAGRRDVGCAVRRAGLRAAHLAGHGAQQVFDRGHAPGICLRD